MKDRYEPRVHLPGQITNLDKDLVSLAKVTSEKKVALNKLVVDVATTTITSQQGKEAGNEVHVELDKKRRELTALQFA